MIDLLLSLVSGGGGILWALGAALLGAIGLYFKGRSDGSAKAENKALKRTIADKDEQLEMNREATEFERKAAGMSDDELNRRITK